MKVTWLTQAGLLFDTGKIKILVDPYLSDSVGKRNAAKHRRIPVDERFFDVKPDVIMITHDHLDHLDPETLDRFLLDADKSITVLAPENAYGSVLMPAIPNCCTCLFITRSYLTGLSNGNRKITSSTGD